MQTFRELLAEARLEKKAIGHFNIADLATLRAIAEAAQEIGAPVVIGTSEGERGFIGVKNAVALVRHAREEYGVPIFLNADHTHSFEKAKVAIDAGYDEILFDGGALPWEDNVRETKRVVEYAREVNPAIVIEGELGYIGSSSEVREALPEGAALRPEDLTTAEQAKAFIDATGVDMLAPAVGNIHGMFANVPDPALDIARIKAIADAVAVPLVLHGASGNTDNDVRAAIAAGITVVHVSTELRRAWREGMEAALEAHPNEVAPYKLFEGSVSGVKMKVVEKLRVFRG